MMSMGQSLRWLSECESTNNEAATWSNDNGKSGSIVIADRQTRGKGRLGRGWKSGDGDLMFSIILKPSNLKPHEAPPLTLLAGLAVFYTVEELGVSAKIKWPNDVYVNHMKLAGVLTEMSTQSHVVSKIIVGVGLNITKHLDLRDVNGIAINQLLKKPTTKWHVLEGFILHFDRLYSEYLVKGDLGCAATVITENLYSENQIISTADGFVSVEPLSVSKNGSLNYQTINGEAFNILAGELKVSR